MIRKIVPLFLLIVGLVSMVHAQDATLEATPDVHEWMLPGGDTTSRNDIILKFDGVYQIYEGWPAHYIYVDGKAVYEEDDVTELVQAHCESGQPLEIKDWNNNLVSWELGSEICAFLDPSFEATPEATVAPTDIPEPCMLQVTQNANIRDNIVYGNKIGVLKAGESLPLQYINAYMYYVEYEKGLDGIGYISTTVDAIMTGDCSDIEN